MTAQHPGRSPLQSFPSVKDYIKRVPRRKTEFLQIDRAEIMEHAGERNPFNDLMIKAIDETLMKRQFKTNRNGRRKSNG